MTCGRSGSIDKASAIPPIGSWVQVLPPLVVLKMAPLPPLPILAYAVLVVAGSIAMAHTGNGAKLVIWVHDVPLSVVFRTGPLPPPANSTLGFVGSIARLL